MDKIAISESLFWQSINIFINKQHVVNKRLWGSTLITKHSFTNVLSNFEHLLDSNMKLKDGKNAELTFMELIKDLNYKIESQKGSTEVDLLLVELLPKSYAESHAFQLICLLKTKLEVKFIDITPLDENQHLCPKFSYKFCLKNNEIILKTDSDVSEKSQQWLKYTVLPQIMKWSKEFTHTNKVCTESLAMVSQDKYYEKYNHLKLKYGKEMVKMWPESTDPTKFVYEDVAIATYLLLLWEGEKSSQRFVDVGCGNGLLVYILIMEGHYGFGIDVRKRKIWNTYPHNVILKEMTITPTNIHTISHCDWIIGNHSDELTPWIPVIAAKTSYKCNFFLLPCCAYNLNGTKYQRQDSSKSQYSEYLEYIQKLCHDFGFKTEFDRLKIPSTKRICLISTKRVYRENEYSIFCDSIQAMVNEQIGINNCNNIDNKLQAFKTRDTIEKVKNCTQIDKSVSEHIIKCVTNYCLEGCILEADWSRGKSVPLNELVELIPIDMLKALKSECGGLQTLLRNNHHIFEVQKGCVRIRYPRTIEEVKEKNIKGKQNENNLKMQVKKCWFFNNHPQGCPLDSSVCSFLHENVKFI